MSAFLLYNIKLSCCLTLFYVGYKFLLSNETFFHFNRKILLTSMLVCALLPLVRIKTETPGIVQQPMIQLEKIMTDEWTFLDNNLSVNDKIETASIPAGKRLPAIPFVQMLALIFGIGSFVQFCLLIRSYISLNLLIRSGRKIKQGNCTIVLLDKLVTPFNYGRFIILSESDYRANPDTILTHEMAHFRLAHSFDIVLMELFTLIQWFNPVIRLLKQEIRKVHEFQADSEVLHTGVDATKYQLLLLKKAVDSRPYTFANSFNHNKLKTRFIMMSKKKSNSWARLKLLWLLPVAALSVYAFACTNASKQSEPVIRSEDTAILPNNQMYSSEFFKTELNKFISEQGVNESLSDAEKFYFLSEKTNLVNLFVNAKDAILLRNVYCPVERLSSDLTAALVADNPNRRPILINMEVDRLTSAEAINKIMQIVGDVFAQNEELFKQKKQPALLFFRIHGEYNTLKLSINSVSEDLTDTHRVSFSFEDGTGQKIRTFTFDNINSVNGLYALEHTDSINELRKLLKNMLDEKSKFKTVSILADSDTPMGIITDLKQLLREQYALKISYSEK